MKHMKDSRILHQEKKVGKTGGRSFVNADIDNFTGVVDDLTFGAIGGVPYAVASKEWIEEHGAVWARLSGDFYSSLAGRLYRFADLLEQGKRIEHREGGM